MPRAAVLALLVSLLSAASSLPAAPGAGQRDGGAALRDAGPLLRDAGTARGEERDAGSARDAGIDAGTARDGGTGAGTSRDAGSPGGELQRALEQEKQRAAQLAATESTLLGHLADLERQVELESRALRAAQAELRLSQNRLAAAQQRVQAAQAEVDTAQAALAPRLMARYQLGREGYVRFLLGARSIGELLRRKRLYTALLEADLAAIDLLRAKVLAARTAEDEVERARDQMAQSASAEQENRSSLELNTALQRKALASVQQEKSVHDQAVRELEQAARALSARMRALEEANRLRASAGLPKGFVGPPPPPGKSGLNANHWDANESAQLGKPAEASAAAGASGEAPGKRLALLADPPMRSQRGSLLFPVESGKVEARFGRTVDPRFGTVTLQRGLDIRAPEGTDVHAVYAGTVVHAGWFSGYGNLVILDHGDGLFTLFAHLSQMAHAVGDVVEKGERLGTVGDTGSLKGPYLYFELRDGPKPVDPEPWLAKPKKPQR